MKNVVIVVVLVLVLGQAADMLMSALFPILGFVALVALGLAAFSGSTKSGPPTSTLHESASPGHGNSDTESSLYEICTPEGNEGHAAQEYETDSAGYEPGTGEFPFEEFV